MRTVASEIGVGKREVLTVYGKGAMIL